MHNDLINIIKRAAMEAVEESGPMRVIIGKVIKSIPLTVSINQKLAVDEDFLVIPERIKNEGFKENEGLIMLRQQGGQQFIVLDKLGGAKDDTPIK